MDDLGRKLNIALIIFLAILFLMNFIMIVRWELLK